MRYEIHTRSHSTKRGFSYVAVTVTPEGVEVPRVLNKAQLAKLGIEIHYFGEGKSDVKGEPSPELIAASCAAANFITAHVLDTEQDVTTLEEVEEEEVEEVEVPNDAGEPGPEVQAQHEQEEAESPQEQVETPRVEEPTRPTPVIDLSDPETKTKLLDKIAALINLSNDKQGATEAEATLVAEKVQEILAKYDLTMEDVEQRENNEDIEELCVDTGGLTFFWRGVIQDAVASFYMCKLLHKTVGGRKRVYVIGKPHHTAVANMMIVYLTAAVDRATKKMRDDRWKVSGDGDRRATASFRIGCAQRIADRLRERLVDSMSGASEISTHLPALQSMYERAAAEVKSFLEKKYPRGGLVGVVKSTMVNKKAFAEGQAAGDKIGLDNQIAQQSKPDRVLLA